jgi:hypothetical protein
LVVSSISVIMFIHMAISLILILSLIWNFQSWLNIYRLLFFVLCAGFCLLVFLKHIWKPHLLVLSFYSPFLSMISMSI